MHLALGQRRNHMPMSPHLARVLVADSVRDLLGIANPLQGRAGHCIRAMARINEEGKGGCGSIGQRERRLRCTGAACQDQ